MTTTAQHTPGPWKQEGFHIWSPSAKANVATVSNPYEGQYVEFNPVEIGSQHSHEAYANARLIATTPKLLETAEDALAYLDSLYGPQFLGVSPQPHTPHAILQQQLLTVIAQAKGKEAQQ